MHNENFSRFLLFTIYYDFQVKVNEVGGTCRKHYKEGKFFTKLSAANLNILHFVLGVRDDVVVKALGYKPAGGGFDSRWCHWNFSVTQTFRSHYGPGVDSASNRNEYQVYFLGVKAAGA